MFTRPKPGEDEDDLLRFQEEFLRSKTAPTATAVSSKRRSTEDPAAAGQCDVVSLGELPPDFPHTTATPAVKKTRCQLPEGHGRSDNGELRSGVPCTERGALHGEALLDGEDLLERHDSHVSHVLADIVERDLTNMAAYCPAMATPTGFPTAPHRAATALHCTHPDGNEKGRKSIFARQFASQKAQTFGVERRSDVDYSGKVAVTPTLANSSISCSTRNNGLGSSGSSVCANSMLLTGAGLGSTDEAAAIHAENVAKLASLSSADILAEKDRLIASLDPSLVAFLRNKRRAEAVTGAQDKIEVEGGERMEGSEEDNTMEEESVDVHDDVQAVGAVTEEQLPGSSEVDAERRWVNMAQTEPDKLAWTADLPAPSPAPEGGLPARFDLLGELVAPDADLPIHLGLHHHGEEPERAGYTLSELYTLCRSASQQQRGLALSTLARVMRLARYGHYTAESGSQLSVCVVPALLDAGLPQLLRWALDERTEGAVAAALDTLHALLVCREDEDAFDAVLPWCGGWVTPSLQPSNESSASPQPTNQSADENEAETDDALAARDVIVGLLRMTLLPRLRYIVEVLRPGAVAVVQAVEILTRVARHSPHAAHQVVQCPRLLTSVLAELLPMTWSPAGEEDALYVAYGRPLPAALKLLRVICVAGRHMAKTCDEGGRLLARVGRYLAEPAGSLYLGRAVGEALQREAWRVWTALTLYGHSSDSITALYPVIAPHLQALATITPDSDYVVMATAPAVLDLLVAALHTASHATHILAENRHTQPTIDEVAELHPMPELAWSHVSGWLEPVLDLLMRTVSSFMSHEVPEDADIHLLASCLRFLSVYETHAPSQPGYNAVEALTRVEGVTRKALLPLVTSHALRRKLASLREHSALLAMAEITEERGEEPHSLPGAGALMGKDGRPCPLLTPNSAILLLSSLSNLVLTMGTVHKDMTSLLYPPLLTQPDVIFYLRKCCKGALVATNQFARFETRLQFDLVLMGRHCTDANTLLHKAVLSLLPRLMPGDEHMAHDLISLVVFNAHFLAEPCIVEGPHDLDLGPLVLSDTAKVAGVSQEGLWSDALQHLASMRVVYMASLAPLLANLEHARARAEGVTHKTPSLMVGQPTPLLPRDWPFMPLVQLYNSTLASPVGAALSSDATARATAALRWLYILETQRADVVTQGVTTATRFSRVLCAFLGDSDLFLDPWVQAYLEALLTLYCRPLALHSMDFSQPIPGIPSFYDLFVSLAEQYSAVSFGDPLFARFLLVPMQQRHDERLRRAVWTEHHDVIRALTLPLDQVRLPLEGFLAPEESSVTLVTAYLRALTAAVVTARRTPLPYLIAVHHVNRFMFMVTRAHFRLRSQLLLTACRAVQPLRDDLLLYCRAECSSDLNHDSAESRSVDPGTCDPERGSPDGMVRYGTLPENRRLRLEAALAAQDASAHTSHPQY